MTKTSPHRPVTALIAAAGQGTRLGADVPKAFVPLEGRTLLERSVAALRAAGVVDEIIVLTSSDMVDAARALLGDAARIVVGGAERADSVWAGLQAIAAAEGTVLVHDAARALTPPALIARVVRAVNPAAGVRAVIPVVAVTDTIKRVNAARVIDTPDRAGLRAVQTPQGFDLATLRAANRAYFAHPDPGFTATDDASLVEWYGEPVTCVDGDPRALKITTPLDLALARLILTQE